MAGGALLKKSGNIAYRFSVQVPLERRFAVEAGEVADKKAATFCGCHVVLSQEHDLPEIALLFSAESQRSPGSFVIDEAKSVTVMTRVNDNVIGAQVAVDKAVCMEVADCHA